MQEVLSLCQEELAAEEPTDGNDRRLAARLRTSLASLLRTAAAPPRPPGAKVNCALEPDQALPGSHPA